MAKRVHADAVLLPGLLGDRLRMVGADRGRDQDPVGGENAMKLEHPRRPSVIRQMGEHRQRPDDVEVAVLERQPGRGLVAKQRAAAGRGFARANRCSPDRCRSPRSQPSPPRRGSGAASVPRRSRSRAGAVPRARSRAAACAESARGLGADLFEEGVRVFRLGQAANPVGQRQRRHRGSGCHSRLSVSAPAGHA